MGHVYQKKEKARKKNKLIAPHDDNDDKDDDATVKYHRNTYKFTKLINITSFNCSLIM